jgi:hypothetical protein
VDPDPVKTKPAQDTSLRIRTALHITLNVKLGNLCFKMFIFGLIMLLKCAYFHRQPIKVLLQLHVAEVRYGTLVTGRYTGKFYSVIFLVGQAF